MGHTKKNIKKKSSVRLLLVFLRFRELKKVKKYCLSSWNRWYGIFTKKTSIINLLYSGILKKGLHTRTNARSYTHTLTHTRTHSHTHTHTRVHGKVRHVWKILKVLRLETQQSVVMRLLMVEIYFTL